MTEYLFSLATPENLLTGFVFILSFLIGSIPFGMIIARFFQVKNLSQKGSGNIGASNVTRVIGFWPAGFLTFALDLLKGVLSILLASPSGSHFLSMVLSGFQESHDFQFSLFAIWMAGLFSILGHCYSPWLHFKGGKGVATGLGVILVLSPISAMVGVITFALTFYYKRIASLSSISGLILAAVTYLILNPVGVHLCVGAAIVLVILIRHEANIDALLENREKSINL